MNTKAKSLNRVLIVALAMALGLVFATTARAQATWSHTFDFAYGMQGWDIYPASGAGGYTGDAFGSVSAVDHDAESPLQNIATGAYKGRVVWIKTDIPVGAVLTSIDVSYYKETCGLTDCSFYSFYTDGGNEYLHLSWHTIDYSNVWETWEDPITVTDEHIVQDLSEGFSLALYVGRENCPTPCTDPGGYAEFTSVTINGTGETDPFDDPAYAPDTFYRPVKAADTTSIENGNQNIQTTQSANVYAITDGTIFTAYQVGSKWNVVINPGTSNPADYLQYYLLDHVNGVPGDTITAGCVLGTAGAIDTSPPSGFLSVLFPEPYQTDWPDFPDSPFATPCDSDRYATEFCIDLNPGFIDDAKYWQSEGNVEIMYRGVTLNSDGAVYQDVVLDPEETYAVSLYVTTLYGVSGAPLDITFGDAAAQVTINAPGAYQFVRIDTAALDPGAPDIGAGTYRLKVKNTADFDHPATPVIVEFVCISTTVADYAPESCYFGSDSLITADSWDTQNATPFTYTLTTGRGGSMGTAYAYDLDPDGYIYQPISLSAFATEDTTYHVTIKSQAGEGAPLLPPYGRLHVYVRDSVTLDPLLDIGEWDLPPIIAESRQLDFTIAAAGDLEGDLVIENTSSEIDMTGWNESVYTVCLSVEGGVWPGYVNIAGAPFAANCTAEPTPPGPLIEVTGDTLLGWIVAWLAFGWDYLGYLIRCQLFTLLNWLWGTILSIRDGIGLFGVWLSMTVSALASWLWTGLGRRFAELIAWLIPIVNVVLAWLLSQPFIMSLLDSLGIAAIWAEGLFTLILAALILFLTAPRFMLILFNIVVMVWSAFINGFSGTPTITLPYPECTNPATPFYDSCLVFDVFNFVVAEVPAIAALLLTIVIAVNWRGVKKAFAALLDALI